MKFEEFCKLPPAGPCRLCGIYPERWSGLCSECIDGYDLGQLEARKELQSLLEEAYVEVSTHAEECCDDSEARQKRVSDVANRLLEVVAAIKKVV